MLFVQKKYNQQYWINDPNTDYSIPNTNPKHQFKLHHPNTNRNIIVIANYVIPNTKYICPNTKHIIQKYHKTIQNIEYIIHINMMLII